MRLTHQRSIGVGLLAASLLVVSSQTVAYEQDSRTYGYGRYPAPAAPYGYPYAPPAIPQRYGSPMPGYAPPPPPAPYGYQYYAPPTMQQRYGAPMTADTPPEPAAQSRQEASDEPSDTQVSIQNMQFSPATITIKAGESVTWQHNDVAPHVVKANDGGFSSDNLSRGQTFSQTFEQPGIYNYYCALHPSMRGEVVVE